MHQILQSYLRRLTNLSGSNRSLLLLRLISEQCMDVHDFDYALDKPSWSIIDGLIRHQRQIDLTQNVDSRDQEANKLGRRLKKVQRIEKFIFDERGARDLYVGWPMVRGKFSDETLVRAPLIFFPVELHEANNVWHLTLRNDVNITFNKSFILAYSFFNKTRLDEELLETSINDLDRDPTVFRTQVYEMLKESEMEINFNQSNFMDQLKRYENYRRSDLEQQEQVGQLKLFPEAVLGIFPQAGSYLVPDYVDLIENHRIKDLEDFFFQRQREDMEDERDTRFSDRLLEENTFTPFELDAYQERALGLIKKGNSLIVQGPPGTGKSQLISNLICDYIARGKNVLLVCQKRAALDVVYNRLKEKLLHDFIGLVHDFKNDRKSIFEQIARQVDKIGEYRQKNNSLDAIQLERTFHQASRKIDQSIEELAEFREMLFDETECGKSVKELYLISDPTQPCIALNQDYRNFNYRQLDIFVTKLRQYLQYYKQFENKSHFWIGGKSFADYKVQDLIDMQDLVRQVVDYAHDTVEKAREILNQKVDFESVEMLSNKPEELEQLTNNLDNERVYHHFRHIVKEPPIVESNWLLEQERVIMQCFKGQGPETSLKSNELGRFQEALEHAINARRGPISWIRWKLFSEDKLLISRVLVSNNLKSNRESFQILLDKIDNRLNYEHLSSQLLKKKWLIDFPKTIRKIDVQNWFFYQKLAFKSYELLSNLRPLESMIPFYKDERKDQVKMLKELITLVTDIPFKKQEWSRYLSETQIRSLSLEKQAAEEATEILRRDFDKLAEYHGLKRSFSHSEDKIAEELISEAGDRFEPEAVIDLLNNSIALAWIDHIETKYPILRAVSSNKLENLEKILRESVEDKKDVSADILLLKSREKTYEDLEYNRLNNLVTYRDLYHQVTKKKRIWPIRRVIANFSEELFKLLPCWMASPESASAIFPMTETFDLVIFDEASQCFSEKAIPALYRGKQIVIAGDSKQLKPFDLYRVRWEEENEDDIPELEIDSLLDLAQQYLPDTKLQGHYRSQALELIEFSNEHFYEHRLRMLPHFDTVNGREKAIKYLKVDGIWENNINIVEAVEVVNLVGELLKNDPTKELGVVTFNARQQSYILDLLDEMSIRRKLSLPESLFVKNIENVQGDERDIIIFSTAYGPDKSGKMQMRFGPLNLEGGENRLNVAITRAKVGVYVVSSILPSQIKVDDAKNLGPKLLKKYLQYAWDISESQWSPEPYHEHDHGDGWYLREKIKEASFHRFDDLTLKKTFQYADLTVIESENLRGMVLTDDEVFHEAASVKEAFVYYPSLLSDKKWPHTRFFSRTFWIDKESILERMKIYLNRVRENQSQS